MTCEAFIHLVSTKHCVHATNAEIAAMASHLWTCQACSARINGYLAMFGRRKLSDAEMKECCERIDRLAGDGEAVAQLSEAMRSRQ